MRTLLGLLGVLVAGWICVRKVVWWLQPDPAGNAAPAQPMPDAHDTGSQNQDKLLEPIRRKYKLPALAAAVVREDKVVAIGAVGVRRAGSPERVTVNDAFHLGSCTKSLTATLLAMLVERGKLSWDTTVAATFEPLKAKIRSEYHPVTLEQLLSHRSGLPDDTSPFNEVFSKLRELDGPMLQQRLKLVELALGQNPAAAPGAKMIYSNYGYALAGAMAEQATGRPWEELLTEMLLKPLGMSTAGFGAMGTPDAVIQPWWHTRTMGVIRPIRPGPDADNPACMGPAGTVHCSIGDFAKYAAFHLRGDHENTELLTQASFQKLHADPFQQGYVMGWGVVARDWAGGDALTHAGSNTMNFAVIWLAPRRNFAIVVATNCGDQRAFDACDSAVGSLIESVAAK